ncbi:MAG: zinc metallopeptidase [Eubacteriales bacterium]
MFGYGYGYYWDPTYVLVLIGAIISMIASARVQSTFNKYNNICSASGLTGKEAAEKILKAAGLSSIRVEHVSGSLSDHYDPGKKVLRLSDDTYSSNSVAAIGVAAHECGHAIQDKEEYKPLVLRSTLVPAANIGSKMGMPLIILGVILSYNYALIQVGIWVFSLAVLFQLVTLPVEFNASSRALQIVGDQGILGTHEVKDCKKVLDAAAMTYVAAAAASILSLIRLVILFGGRRDD